MVLHGVSCNLLCLQQAHMHIYICKLLRSDVLLGNPCIRFGSIGLVAPLYLVRYIIHASI